MKDLVTVVTLTYKKFDYIFDTIKSVLEQDYDEIEYIISDDGSESFPLDEINLYIDKHKKNNLRYFKILCSKSNRGTVKNINDAYKEANGKYLIPLSADDQFYSNNVISRIVEEFENSESKIVVTSRMLISEAGQELRLIPNRFQQQKIASFKDNCKQNIALRTQHYYGMASGCVLCLKKDFIRDWGYFDERYVLWEDGPFLTQYTESNKLNFSYHIVSIKYRDGGVSSAPGNPIMDNDMKTYNYSDRIKNLESLSIFNRRTIKYINKRFDCTSRLQIVFLYLRFIDVIAFKIKYKIENAIWNKIELKR